jgi:hypothetical protein
MRCRAVRNVSEEIGNGTKEQFLSGRTSQDNRYTRLADRAIRRTKRGDPRR